MVLSNSKLKRKKREEAAAVGALALLPDSNATPSPADVVKGDGSAVLSSKKKKRPKAKKVVKVNGDAEDGAADVAANEGNGSANVMAEVTVAGGTVHDEAVQQPKKRKNVPEVVFSQEIPMENNGDKLPPSGVSEENGEGGAAGVHAEASPGQGQAEEAPKMKIRKKPRWAEDENGKRIKPGTVGGESQGPSEGTKASTSSGRGPGKGDDSKASEKNNGDASGAVDNGARLYQGDEPWLESKRKKKKNLTDRWGKKLDNGGAVGDEHVNQDASQDVFSLDEKVDPKKVMVGGMPYYISEDDIHEYFQECGTIAELDCMTFPDTGRFKGIAFITFRTEEAAKRALALDGADMGGRFLKIEVCKIKAKELVKKDVYKEPPKKHEGCLSAYIGNLSWDITEKELWKFFKGCKIDAIRFSEDKETGGFRGFGHVDFADDESLEAAMKLDQMEVLGRPLKIAYSVPKKNQYGDKNQPGAKKKGCFTCGEGHVLQLPKEISEVEK